MTPEMIRAAEGIREWCSEDGKSPETYDPIVAAQILADGVLAHRSDYGPNCEPLPVDEGFCESLGATIDRYARYSLAIFHPSEDLTLRLHFDVSGRGTSAEMWNSGNDPTDIPLPKDRPTLRALLQTLGAMGGGA